MKGGYCYNSQCFDIQLYFQRDNLAENTVKLGGCMVKILLNDMYKRMKNLLGHDRRKQAISNYETANGNFVFEDASRKRKIVIWCFLCSLAILALMILVISGLSIYLSPLLPKWDAKEVNEFSNIRPSGKATADPLTPLQTDTDKNSTFEQKEAIHMDDRYAFYVNWDPNSEQSLRRNIDTIDVLIPQWFHVQPNLELGEDIQKDIGNLAKKHDVKVVPLISNLIDNEWNQEVVHNLLISPPARSKLIQDLHGQIKKYGYDGINIDFENIKAEDRELLTSFMQELYSVFHSDGLLVTMDMPPNDNAFDYNALNQYSDKMVVMLYDENFQTPGPIASSIWYQENLARIPKDKLVVSLGNYGYDWEWESSEPGKVVSFENVMRMADKANLQVQWDDMSKSPYVRYMDKDKLHELWFLDGVTFYNQLEMASAAGVKGVALWRLGTEDPAVWDILENRGIDTLRHIKDSDSIYSYGKGNIFRAASSQEQGKRELILNDSDQISGEVYQSMPKSSEMERLGNAEAKEVVLTFDDGPDPEYTTRILNILKQYHIKATFFVIGKNAMLNKDIVQRIYMEGHEIGNHTFSHRHTNSISYNQLKLELNASQRVIQGITGHSSLLYRPPYGYVDTPTVNQDFKRMLYTTEMGYLTVNYDIDSRDWEATSSKEIVDNVLQELPNGNVILLHDGGGDRSSTVEALPEIIETLQNKGYTFVTASKLMNTERSSIMPSVKKVERPLVESFKIIIGNLTSLNGVISLLLYTVLALSVLRVFILVYFALRHKRQAQLSKAGNDSFQPFVSVIIAAYNEEKVISRTVQSILKSDYQHYEIIVVDDGSQDRTSAIVSENFSSNERVHLIRKKNGGKSSALNRGMQKAKGDIIIAIDADTIISHKAMSLLVPHFIDKKVAAVSGNMRVGNMRNLLTISQHIEYVTGFNLEKRAFSFLNCVTVVPGAIGAWRKQVILECGGFTDDTLAEDTDMTLRILCQGYTVAIEENAYAYTEAPEGIRGFFKQRYRWTYGTLQCLWKHKRAVSSREQKSLSCIAIPNMLLFQYALPLVAPVLDALAIFGALSGDIKKATLFYVGFFIIDLVICLFTFRLEKLSLKPLISLFLQRMFYRYLMPLVVWKSIYAAIKGTRVGWNKLQRSGNLEMGESVKRTG